jgi:hypothetical protein
MAVSVLSHPYSLSYAAVRSSAVQTRGKRSVSFVLPQAFPAFPSLSLQIAFRFLMPSG